MSSTGAPALATATRTFRGRPSRFRGDGRSERDGPGFSWSVAKKRVKKIGPIPHDHVDKEVDMRATSGSHGLLPPGEERTLEGLADQDLVEAMARGNEDALSQLYDRYSGVLLALAVRMLGDTERAGEVLQAVFLYVWKRAASYDRARASVTTWLSLITRSRCLDRLRRRTTRRQAYALYHRENPSPSVPPGNFRWAFDRQRAHRVRQALALLPDAQREVIEVCYYAGFSQREAAEALDIPLGTVKTRTSLAMQKLRTSLAGEIRQLM